VSEGDMERRRGIYCGLREGDLWKERRGSNNR